MSAIVRLLGMVLGLCICAAAPAATTPAAASAQMLGAPLRFEPNRGQSDAKVRFLARGSGYGLFLTDDEAVMRFEVGNQHGAPIDAVLRLRLDGAQPARLRARLPQGGRSNYLTLDGSRAPITDLPHYSELVQRQRYPGIDVVYYGNDGELEYDFVLAPRADPRQIAIGIDGAQAVSIAPNGDLHLDIGGRTLVQRAPVAFQYADVAVAATADATRLRHTGSERISVAARYAIGADGRVHFELGSYDSRRPLVIDPVLSWSTCLGGSADDHIRDLAVGSFGDTYLVGETRSADFPTAAPLIGYGGGLDAFVTRMNAGGNGLHYSTYIGGTADDQLAYGVAVNGNGEAHVVGRLVTAANGIQGFIVKLNAAGNAVVYSSVFGGSGSDIAESVALDSLGNAVVVGWTDSSNFPILNAVQGTPGGDYDGFIRRHSSTGVSLSSSYFGGANAQFLKAVAVGVNDTIYIGGETRAQDPYGDALMAKLNANATSLLYSRRLAGSLSEVVNGIAVDGGSRPHLVGYTNSPDFPLLNPLDGSFGGGDDAFLTVLDATGATLASTYLGDLQHDTAESVAIVPGGDVLIAGTLAGAPLLARISASFQSLLYSVDFGTGGIANGVRVDAAGAAYVAGSTENFGSFPSTPGAFQACTQGVHGFVAKIVDGSPTLSIGDASASEGAAEMVFTLTLSAPVPQDVYFDFTTANGSAIAYEDYTPTWGTWSIPAGTTQFTWPVEMREDSLDEANETFSFTLSNIRGASGGDLQAIGTIVDNDPAPTLSIDNGGCSVVEGNAGSLNCNFVARLSAASSRPVTFNTATAIGSASAGSDFIAHASTARSIAAGQTTLTIAVPVLADTLDEINESFLLNISGVANATPGSLSGTGTIDDDDAPPALTLDGCAVTEGASGQVPCNFVVRLSAPSGLVVSMQARTHLGSAGDADLVGFGLTPVSIPAGQTAQTIPVQVLGDLMYEGEEQFTLQLSGISNASSNSFVQAQGRILDDDPVPTLSVQGCSVTEGDSGSSNCAFTVLLSNPTRHVVGFTSTTVDGTAIGQQDFVFMSDSRTIASGQTSLTITVPVIGDLADEFDETFSLSIANVSNAAPGSASGIGTIVDNDAPPTLSVINGGCSVIEGQSGSRNCEFTVLIAPMSGKTVSFQSATGNGSATAGADYTSHAATTRTIVPNTNNVVINVPVLGDTLDEDNETFALNISGVSNATPGSLSATGSITDDDVPPTLSIDNGGCSVTEGNSGTINCSFVARLSAVSGRAVSFTSATANGTASAGSDYTAHSGIGRTLNAGLQTLTVLVPVLGDSVDESNETFALNLTAVSNATPGSLSGAGTIVDDDDPPTTGSLRMRDLQVQINESAGSVQLVVERVNGSSGAASVNYATSNGTALAGLDYSAASGTLNWASGDASTRTLTLTIINDPASEPDETFSVTLTQASGASMGTPATTTVLIRDGSGLLHVNGFE